MTFYSMHFIILFLATVSMLSMLNVSSKRMEEHTVKNIRNIILLVVSYVFIGIVDWIFCIILAFITIVTYLSAIQVYDNSRNRIWLIIGIFVPLATLGVFKYYNFFYESFSKLLGLSHGRISGLILPLGISFYTFSAISYVVDVYHSKYPASRDIIKVALYLSFFPKLVAGPIIRGMEFFVQLDDNRNISIKNFEVGIQIFIFGLFKKVVLADRIGIFVDDIYAAPAAFSSVTILLAVISYSFQLYFDFSGYSDMAIGLAKILGFDFSKNFNLPYISRNVTEFWKRWHISLSSWLRDYLYIPLGGNSAPD
jgi:alginate O-acetyltransferase complex protein AlgI